MPTHTIVHVLGHITPIWNASNLPVDSQREPNLPRFLEFDQPVDVHSDSMQYMHVFHMISGHPPHGVLHPVNAFM